MKLEEKNIIVKRPYKTVYKCDDSIVKVFAETHPKSDVFNEALNTARVEEAGTFSPNKHEISIRNRKPEGYQLRYYLLRFAGRLSWSITFRLIFSLLNLYC